MKTFMKISSVFLLLAALILLQTPAVAQTAPTITTLSAAMTKNQTTITLTSATGVTVQSTANQINTAAFVDGEYMWITSLVSGTTYSVIRGKGGTIQTAHNSSAIVYLGPPNNGPFKVSAPIMGSCTSTSEIYLPIIYVPSGQIWDCSTTGGKWFHIADGTMNPRGQHISGACTATTGSAETEYLNSAACSGATTATTRKVIPYAGTLKNLRIYSSATAVGGTGKDVATVQVNGSDTSITCTIAATGTTCSDTSHSVAVSAGDVVTFKFVTATSDTAANVSAAVGLY